MPLEHVHFNKDKKQWEILMQGEWVACEKPKMPLAKDINNWKN